MPPHAPESINGLLVVDLLADGPLELSVDRPYAASGSRPIEPKLIDRLRHQVDAVHDAERHRDKVRIPKARAALGRTLWELLDGPDRWLTRAADAAVAQGEALHLVLRLRTGAWPAALAGHPAVTWRWELLCPHTGEHPSASGDLRLVVQLGDVDPRTPPRTLEHGGLRIMLMAYSPDGVRPVLEYEVEEERIFRALARPLEERKAQIVVVEDGTLAALEERLRETEADVVHLTGHGRMTPEGPRLAMEDDLGHLHEVSPDELLQVLRCGPKPPQLVVISSCHSAEGRDGTPSFAAALVDGGMPAVLGWVQPVGDDVATLAAAELYERLCQGDTPAEAVAFVRTQLLDHDRHAPHPSQAWGTLHLLTRDARGFRVDGENTKALPTMGRSGDALYRRLRSLGGMQVLAQGFVGRRRQLQRTLRILHDGRDDDRDVAGVVVLGMKGVGKSCLVGRVLDRHGQRHAGMGVVVLHGVLDDIKVLERFIGLAVERKDAGAEAILRRTDEDVPKRIERLLSSDWSEARIIIVLDDFEQNLELRDDGRARLSPAAATLLEVLLPRCLAHRPKLIITTTASFEGSPRYEQALAELGLGSLESPSVFKLWTGMPKEQQDSLSPREWTELAERLGRNARVLDWARMLLQGRTPEEVKRIALKAGEELPKWKQREVPSDENVDELARLFLRTTAINEARARLHPDALTFVKRARVYESPVTIDAFEGLVDGLSVVLERDVVVLQNLGLLEVGELDGQRAHRVSPLVEPRFETNEGERWHSVAADYWEQASNRGGIMDRFERLLMAWRHALAGFHQDVAARCGRGIRTAMHNLGLHGQSRLFAHEHLRVFPESETALLWAGSAEERAGNPYEGWRLHEIGEKRARERNVARVDLARILTDGAHILVMLGRYQEAEERMSALVGSLQRGVVNGDDYAGALYQLASVQQRMSKYCEARANLDLAIATLVEVHGTDAHQFVAACLHSLAGVLLAQGDLAGARARLERSLSIKAKVHGSDEHPDVAASLHELARVLLAQGEFAGARALLERSFHILVAVHETEKHPDVSASLYQLTRVLLAQGDLAGARVLAERSHHILLAVHETEEHPDVAASLHELACVLRAQDDLVGARALLERSLRIDIKVHGTDETPSTAASMNSLAGVLRAQGDLVGARALLERSLDILARVHGTDKHPSTAAASHELAGVLLAQGDLAGARERLEHSHEILIAVHGTEDHPDVAASFHEIARVLGALGDLANARAFFERSLSIKAKVFGTDEHPDVASSLHELARVLVAQGDFAGARARLERSLKIDIQVHGTEEHRSVAASLHELAGVLRAQGDFAGARAHTERSHDILVKVHGTDEHPDVAASLHEFAAILRAQGDLAGALARIQRSHDILVKVHGTDEHPDVAASLNVLGAILRAQGDLASARLHLERSISIYARVYGTDEHLDVATSLHELASVLLAQDDLAGARAALERSLHIDIKAHGTDEHPSVAASLHSLSAVLLAQGELTSARAHLERSLSIKALGHGTDGHPDVAASLLLLAGILATEGHPEEAVATYRRVLEIEHGMFGTRDQYYSAETEFSLAMVLVKLGQVEEARRLLVHVHAVLSSQDPGHPLISRLRRHMRRAPSC